MTVEAPAASALEISPEEADATVGDQRHAMVPLSAVATLSMAMICGTPTPATMRVVQIEPGSDADLDRVGAGFDQCQRSCAGGDVAADDLDVLG